MYMNIFPCVTFFLLTFFVHLKNVTFLIFFPTQNELCHLILQQHQLICLQINDTYFTKTSSPVLYPSFYIGDNEESSPLAND